MDLDHASVRLEHDDVRQACPVHPNEHVRAGDQLQLVPHRQPVHLDTLDVVRGMQFLHSVEKFLLVGYLSLDDTAWVARMCDVVVSP